MFTFQVSVLDVALQFSYCCMFNFQVCVLDVTLRFSHCCMFMLHVCVIDVAKDTRTTTNEHKHTTIQRVLSVNRTVILRIFGHPCVGLPTKQNDNVQEMQCCLYLVHHFPHSLPFRCFPIAMDLHVYYRRHTIHFKEQATLNVWIFYKKQHIGNTRAKVVPLHAMKALGWRGGIVPIHSRPRY
jgi:hypothetical protein